jgi:trimeric autotransporter adhesin
MQDRIASFSSSLLVFAGSFLYFGTATGIASGQSITTVAGNGTQGNTGDGGLAVNAELTFPEGTAVDGAGNSYIISEDVIRRVDASTGIITTVAGGGTSLGDGVPATSAQLFQPLGIAVDGSGNLYIGDTGSSRVRKVTASTGLISTIAGIEFSSGFSGDGGAATSAEVNSPAGVALDASGNVYFADDGNSRVRKITVSTNTINTVAGNGIRTFAGDNGPATSASLAGPIYVAVDSASNVFISENVNVRVREVTASNGFIQTVAGTGGVGFNGDGIAATIAELSNPLGLSVDGSGNLFIADNGNERIREVSTTGMINTIAGNGTAGFSGDGSSPISAELNSPGCLLG